MKKFLTSAVLSILASGMLFAQSDNSVTLPDGTVLKNPFLLGRTPATITVGHDDGAMRIAIKDLPAELQKELNYDPAKAAKYAQTEAARIAVTEKNLAESERRQEILSLQKKIQTLKVQIAADEANRARLEAVFSANKEATTSLAAVQPSTRGRRYIGRWGRWGVRRFHHRGGNRASNRAVRERIRQIRRMNAESEGAAQAFFELDRRIQAQKIRLGELELQLAQLKSRK